MGVSRRGLLIGAAGTAGVLVLGAAGGYELVEHDVLPGRLRLNAMLGEDPPPPDVPQVRPGPMVNGTFASAQRNGIDVAWTVAYPPGYDANAHLPVTVALHGRGGDHTWPFGGLSLQYYLADAVLNHGVAPFAIASVDGGDATNWHPRADGDNPQGMVVKEFVPLLRDRGLATQRLGLWGWSLGGYGALLLATVLGPRRVAAVVASSPALWPTAAETAPDVFDDAADYDRNNVYTRIGRLKAIPLRIDVGDNDSFQHNDEEFRAMLSPTPAGGVSHGFHDASYWMRVAPAEIAFLGQHLG